MPLPFQPKIKTESPVSGGKPISFASLTSGKEGHIILS